MAMFGLTFAVFVSLQVAIGSYWSKWSNTIFCWFHEILLKMARKNLLQTAKTNHFFLFYNWFISMTLDRRITVKSLNCCWNYLLSTLSLTTWQRAGVLAAVTATGLKEAIRCEKTKAYALTVCKHKTSSTVTNFSELVHGWDKHVFMQELVLCPFFSFGWPWVLCHKLCARRQLNAHHFYQFMHVVEITIIYTATVSLFAVWSAIAGHTRGPVLQPLVFFTGMQGKRLCHWAVWRKPIFLDSQSVLEEHEPVPRAIGGRLCQQSNEEVVCLISLLTSFTVRVRTVYSQKLGAILL